MCLDFWSNFPLFCLSGCGYSSCPMFDINYEFDTIKINVMRPCFHVLCQLCHVGLIFFAMGEMLLVFLGAVNVRKKPEEDRIPT